MLIQIFCKGTIFSLCFTQCKPYFNHCRHMKKLPRNLPNHPLLHFLVFGIYAVDYSISKTNDRDENV